MFEYGNFMTIIQFNPILCAFLGACALSEQTGKEELIAVLSCVAGVALILKPNFVFIFSESSSFNFNEVTWL